MQEYIPLPSLDLRICKLHRIVFGKDAAIPKKEVKKDAWTAKTFCVLLKRKVRKGHKSKNAAFQRLLNVLNHVEEAGAIPALCMLPYTYFLSFPI